VLAVAPWEAIRNSLVFGLAATVVALVVGGCAPPPPSAAAARRRSWTAR
jgi:ABC-type Fe3+ transport system permease subunit